MIQDFQQNFLGIMHWLGIICDCSPALTVYNYKNRDRSLRDVCLASRSDSLFAQGPSVVKDGLSGYLVSQGRICPSFQEQCNCFNVSAEHCCMQSRRPILRENESECQELSSQPSVLCLAFITNHLRDAMGITQSYTSVSFLILFKVTSVPTTVSSDTQLCGIWLDVQPYTTQGGEGKRL